MYCTRVKSRQGVINRCHCSHIATKRYPAWIKFQLSFYAHRSESHESDPLNISFSNRYYPVHKGTYQAISSPSVLQSSIFLSNVLSCGSSSHIQSFTLQEPLCLSAKDALPSPPS